MKIKELREVEGKIIVSDILMAYGEKTKNKAALVKFSLDCAKLVVHFAREYGEAQLTINAVQKWLDDPTDENRCEANTTTCFTMPVSSAGAAAYANAINVVAGAAASTVCHAIALDPGVEPKILQLLRELVL